LERTLAILKPDCVQRNLIGKVIEKIEAAGFKIVAMKMIRLSKESARGFYEVHKERPFFNDLIEYMTSGFCVPMVLEKENAVEDFRKLIEQQIQQKQKKEQLENFMQQAFRKILSTAVTLLKTLLKKSITFSQDTNS